MAYTHAASETASIWSEVSSARATPPSAYESSQSHLFPQVESALGWMKHMLLAVVRAKLLA